MNRKYTFFLTTLLLLFGMVGNAYGQGASNNMSHDTGKIQINITGGQNVPKFSINPSNDTGNKYNIFFSQVFEVIDTNENGRYDPGNDTMVPASMNALAAFSWQFSEIDESQDGAVQFNITSTGGTGPFGSFSIQFRIYISDDASEFKFDVVMSDYDFRSDSEDVLLVLAFMITGANEDDDLDTENEGEDTVKFGDAYFETETTAESGNSTINVGISHGEGEGNPFVYLAYERFDGSFDHDPTVGVQSSAIGPGDDRQAELNGFVFITTFVALIAIPIFIRRLRN
jgi:hypothetical protein